MLAEVLGECIKSNVSIASCSWIVFCVGVRIDLASLLKSLFGVRGMEEREELDPCPEMAGGFVNLGVCERLDDGCGRISAGGARETFGTGGEITL